MMLTGLNACTLIDYPGQVACVVFTLGCNLRCGYCHNSEFVLPEKIKHLRKEIDAEVKFFAFLEKRQGLLSGVSICGGEPTIHKDLPRFCRQIKHLGYKVKLDTNGTNPDMLESLIREDLVDYIAMDIKHVPESLERVTGNSIDWSVYQRSIDLVKSAPSGEFRTTVIGGTHEYENIEAIVNIIGNSKPYYLQAFRPGNTLDTKYPGYMLSEETLIGWRIQLQKSTGINILSRF